MGVLERSTIILETLAEKPGQAWTVHEVVDATGIPAASCCRLLQQLRDLAWVDQAGQRSDYRLGPRAFALVGGAPYRPDIVTAARTAMLTLAEQWPDSGVVLVKLSETGQEVLWVCGAYDQSTLHHQTRQQAPWHGPAARILVANLSSKERMRWINRVGLPNHETWPGIANRSELLAALAQMRRDQHCSQHRKDHNMSALAVPVHLAKKRENAAELVSLGLYFPLQDISLRRIDALHTATASMQERYENEDVHRSIWKN